MFIPNSCSCACAVRMFPASVLNFASVVNSSVCVLGKKFVVSGPDRKEKLR